MTKPIPEGYHTVTPSLTVEGAQKVIDFVKQTFGAQQRGTIPTPDGKIAHAEVMIGDSIVMLGDATPQNPAMPGSLYLYVENCDDAYRKGLQAGGKKIATSIDQRPYSRNSTSAPRRTVPSQRRSSGWRWTRARSLTIISRSSR